MLGFDHAIFLGSFCPPNSYFPVEFFAPWLPHMLHCTLATLWSINMILPPSWHFLEKNPCIHIYVHILYAYSRKNTIIYEPIQWVNSGSLYAVYGCFKHLSRLRSQVIHHCSRHYVVRTMLGDRVQWVALNVCTSIDSVDNHRQHTIGTIICQI